MDDVVVCPHCHQPPRAHTRSELMTCLEALAVPVINRCPRQLRSYMEAEADGPQCVLPADHPEAHHFG